MKKLLTLILLSAVSFASHAGPMTWTDTIDFEENIYFSSLGLKVDGNWQWGVKSYEFTHDLTADGFNFDNDRIDSASLSINLFDDASYWFDEVDFFGGWKEIATVEEGGSVSQSFELDYVNVDLGVSISGISSLNDSGMLTVKINHEKGDFYLGGSELVAEGVPAPETFVLFALAIVGFSVAQRKRRIG